MLRLVGLVVGAVGAALIAFARGSEAGGLLFWLGWLVALVALFPLLLPSLCQQMYESVLETLVAATDLVALRAIGVVAVGVGGLLVYVGLRVL